MSYPIVVNSLSKFEPIKGTITSSNTRITQNSIDSTIVDITGSIFNNNDTPITFFLEVRDGSTTVFKRKITLESNETYQIIPSDTYSLSYGEEIYINVLDWTTDIAGKLHYHFEKTMESGNPIVIDYGFQEVKEEVIRARRSYIDLDSRIAAEVIFLNQDISDLDIKYNEQISDLKTRVSALELQTSALDGRILALEEWRTTAQEDINNILERILGINQTTWNDLQNIRNEVIAARGIMPSLDSRLDVSLHEDGTLKQLPFIVEGYPENWTFVTTVDTVNADEFNDMVAFTDRVAKLETLTVVNNSSNTAAVKVAVTDGADNIRAVFLNSMVSVRDDDTSEDPHSLYFTYDINLNLGEKIRVWSDQPDINFIISGKTWKV